jgi:hypothetical protein
MMSVMDDGIAEDIVRNISLFPAKVKLILLLTFP